MHIGHREGGVKLVPTGFRIGMAIGRTEIEGGILLANTAAVVHYPQEMAAQNAAVAERW
jgi:hypothetical protein